MEAKDVTDQSPHPGRGAGAPGQEGSSPGCPRFTGVEQREGLEAWLDALTLKDPPILATTAARVCAWRENPLGRSDELADILTADASVSASILKVANSALYRRSPNPMTELGHAVAELGVDRVVEVALACAVVEDFASEDRTGRVCEELGVALHASAQARMICQEAGLGDDPAVSLLALLSRLGPIVLWSHLDRLDERFSAWPLAALRAGCGHDSVEWDLLCFEPRTLSELLAQRWRLRESSRVAVLASFLQDHQVVAIEIAHDLAAGIAHRPRTRPLEETISRLSKLTGQDEASVVESVLQVSRTARAFISERLSQEVAHRIFVVHLPGEVIDDEEAASTTRPEFVPAHFQELQMLRGAEMEVDSESEGSRRTLPVRFCGAEAGKGMLVMPQPADWKAFRTGSQLMVKGFNGRFAFEFEARLCRIIERPGRCWMLSYPESVNARSVRAAHRLRTALVVKISQRGSVGRLTALGADISPQGMQLISEEAIGSQGQALRLMFALYTGERTRTVEFDCVIRHSRFDEKAQLHRTGVAFEPGCDRESALGLSEFVAQRMSWLQCA
ncbi:HDOD domain-containing protein [Pseudomarimonas salicorniae]|uniref:HDOD domain-containing protein n=1 Tax=Pseudomarimonas salicorniae TaxID=2933270 RepID=A0ABT0GG68_9GAMM|nr:HDOD domain-containing protein [Lysobacter sp. CAU 1642]MCK7593010.1 HDOD domain-containing protein [Lysobacter sp. CAU 1642]